MRRNSSANARSARILLLNLFHVIEVVGERGMHVGERNGGDVRDDLVGGHALMLVTHNDIEHTDAMLCNTGFANANT